MKNHAHGKDSQIEHQATKHVMQNIHERVCDEMQGTMLTIGIV